MAAVRFMTYGPLLAADDYGYGIVYYVPQTVSPSMSYMMIL
jgi:hypothetical protein